MYAVVYNHHFPYNCWYSLVLESKFVLKRLTYYLNVKGMDYLIGICFSIWDKSRLTLSWSRDLLYVDMNPK